MSLIGSLLNHGIAGQVSTVGKPVQPSSLETTGSLLKHGIAGQVSSVGNPVQSAVWRPQVQFLGSWPG